MPLKNFKTIGELQTYEYLLGKITSIDIDTDTCGLTIGDTEYHDVPIFFHCSPDAEELENGALKEGALAFREDDQVVVLKQRNSEVGTGGTPEIFVIAHYSDKRHCDIGVVVIISTQSEEEAFAWNLETNEVVVEVTTLAGVIRELGRSGTLLEPSGSEEDTWSRSYPSEHDAILNLPTLVNGDYPDDGLDAIDTVPYPATPSYSSFGYINKWAFSHYYMDNPFDATEDRVAPYLLFAYGQADETAKDEFEELTGLTWLPDIDPGYGNPLRQYLFWHPVFGYPADDVQAILENLQSTLEPFFDSWADAIWTEPPPGEVVEVVSVAAPYRASGIATLENVSAIFEHAGVCVDWEDSACSNPETCYKSLLRMYLRNDDYLSGGLSKGCFDAVNAERLALSLSELVLNFALSKAAERHLADSIAHFSENFGDPLSHTGSDGSTPFTRAEDAGFSLWIHRGQSFSVGENLNYNGATDDPVTTAIESWRASTEGHWELLTSALMKETGVAVGSIIIENELGENETYYVFIQVFGWRDNIWPGFSPIDTSDMKTYMENNFTFAATEDNTRVPKVYLT